MGRDVNLSKEVQSVKRIIVFITRYVYAVLSCIYLFTIGFLFEKNRFLISTICEHFGYVEKTPKAILPTIELSEVAPEHIPIQVREPVEVDGNISLAEIAVISKLVKLHNPTTLFEIGTFDGRTTLNLAANSSQDAKVYTLDLPQEGLSETRLSLEPGEEKYIEKKKSGSRYLNTDCEKKITQLYGDSATFDFSPFFDAIDFIFIDGSHSYEYILNDSEQVLKLLRNRKGIILWHDYDKPWWGGLTSALNEMYLSRDEFKNIKQIKGTSLVCLIVE